MRVTLLTLVATCLLAVSASAAATPSAVLSVSDVAAGPGIPPGFVGLSTEYWDIPKLVGTSTQTPDRPFERLWRALAPDADPSLRIAGDSSDWTWWPIPGMAKPPWVHLALTPQYAATVRELADDTHARLILGINLAADSARISAYEVSRLAAHIPAARIQAFELGNEPDLYNMNPFYLSAAGTQVRARGAQYGPAAITSDWQNIAARLGNVPLAGPAYSNFDDLAFLPGLLSAKPAPSVLTVHTYPLESQRCNGNQRLSMGELFDAHSLVGLAQNVATWSRIADRFGSRLRADEMNAVTCGGQVGFSDTFGPALWALNVLALYAETQVSGVNFAFETYTTQDLFAARQTASGWTVDVQPEYYGLRAFAQLAPPGSHILSVSAAPHGLMLWADSTPEHQTNVVITNISARPETTRLDVAGVVGGGAGRLTRLTTASPQGLWATRGVRLAGQTVDPDTGLMTGAAVSSTIRPAHGGYSVTVPAASAAILTLDQPVVNRSSHQ